MCPCDRAQEYLEDRARWESPRGTSKSIVGAGMEEHAYVNEDSRTQNKSRRTGERIEVGEEENKTKDLCEEDAGQLEEKWQRHKVLGEPGERIQI
ncbi:hypothetical protein NDU88_000230 [Pleurodeles waltl]|uniref:Uncharacterized protein n=1 Tax=Pleurodeles waltl TaxID=8319 RepID=A0AAV7P0R6_PLEWA|nr:hypothetical protein NDU88_000230 [Pleurodeles waltl]